MGSEYLHLSWAVSMGREWVRTHPVMQCLLKGAAAEEGGLLTLRTSPRASLVAQWLTNPSASAGDSGSIRGPGRSHMPLGN